MSIYTYDIGEIFELAQKGHVIEVEYDGAWSEISVRKGLDDDEKYRAKLKEKRNMFTKDGKHRIFEGDQIAFKQRESRHLSVYSDLEFDYQPGTVIGIIDDNKFNVLWLDGHSSRTDQVHYDDIVSIFDISAKYENPEFLFLSGTMVITQEIADPKNFPITK